MEQNQNIRNFIKKSIKDLLNENNPEFQKEFIKWKRNNVSQNADGSYSTQDALYKNKLINLDALKQYYIKEFLR